MATKPRHAEELSYFNAIACLMVIFIHVVSYGIVNVTPDSFHAALIYFPWKLFACVVPAFLFSSAAKMAFRYEESYTLRQYGGYIAGRVKNIFLPYLLWYIVYFAVYVLMGYRALSIPGFFKELLLGTLSYQFYYIVIAMQFYFLKPLWLWILRHLSWYIALPAAVLITYLSLYLNSFLDLWDAEFVYKDRIFTSYLFFWVAGLYAGRSWDKLTESLDRAGTSIAVGALCVFAVLLIPYLQYSRGTSFVDTAYHKLFTDILSIIILLWICLKLRGAGNFVKKPLSFISAASYPVFLSHCLFLTLAEHYIWLSGLAKTSVILIIRFLVCYSLPFILYALTSRLWGAIRKRVAE